MVTRKMVAASKTSAKPAVKKSIARKTVVRQSAATTTEVAMSAVTGRARFGGLFDPMVESPAEVKVEPQEPRPYTTGRYPHISNAQFDALKAAAPRAKLAPHTAQRSKDVPGRGKPKAMLAPEAMIPGGQPSAAPVAATNFAGITATGWLPPDCTLAAGPAHLLVSVNSSLALYTKAGAAVFQRSLTQWFANVATGLTIFDPKALFDQHAGRWVLLAVAILSNPKTSVHLLSVSATADPNGPWRNYRFDAMRDGNVVSNNWADYPSLGVDNQALYVTTNMFAFGGGFQYVKLRVIPKAGPYAGGAAPFNDFVGLRNADNTLAFTVQPCHTFGAPNVEYLVNTQFPSGNTMSVWRVVNGAGAPTLSRTQVAISPFSLAPNADQKGGNAPLNTGDVRVLHAVFRGDSIWTAFTTAHNWGVGANRAAIQWCQIRAAVPAVVQQGVYGASTGHYFYPAACPDGNGNVTMVFSRSATTEFGSIRFTGRRATDPLGAMQASASLQAGVANYVGLDNSGRNRWGDYNGVASDPANPRAVWFYSEFASAPNTWATWVGSAMF